MEAEPRDGSHKEMERIPHRTRDGANTFNLQGQIVAMLEMESLHVLKFKELTGPPYLPGGRAILELGSLKHSPLKQGTLLTLVTLLES